MTQSATQQQGAERRRAGRVALKLPAAIRRSCDKQKPVVLACLSTTGCAVKNIVNLRPGDRVWVRLPGLEGQLAQIRWARLDAAGVEFEQPLHPVIFERISNLDPQALAA